MNFQHILSLSTVLSLAAAAHQSEEGSAPYLVSSNDTHSFPVDKNFLVSFIAKHYRTSQWCDKTQSSSTGRRLLCKRLVRSTNITVQLADAAELLTVLPVPVAAGVERARSRYQSGMPPSSAGQCHLVMFFMTSCQFSALAAPNFNALARHVPDVQLLALDIEQSRSVSTRFGVVSVPMFVLFHEGRPAALFNGSEPTLAALGGFLRHVTNVSVLGGLWPEAVTAADLRGPVWCSPGAARWDECLLAAWLFVGVASVYWAVRCRIWLQTVHAVDTWWREAQLHLHTE